MIVGIALIVIAAGAVAAVRLTASKDTPAEQANKAIAAGVVAQQAGDNTKAQRDYARALKKDPTNAVAAYDLGQLAQAAGNSTAAIAYYQQAVASNPKLTAAMFNEAILVSATQPQQAIDLYKQIVTMQPKAATAFLNLGLLEIRTPATLQQGEVDLAQAGFLDPTLTARIPAGLQIPKVIAAGAPAPTAIGGAP